MTSSTGTSRVAGIAVLTVLAVTTLLVHAPRAQACSCSPPPPLTEVVGRSDVAVIGTVEAVHERDDLDSAMRPRLIEMVLAVDEVVAGDETTPTGAAVEHLSVFTDSTSCGSVAQPGGVAAVVTTRSRDGLLMIGACVGSITPEGLRGIAIDLPAPTARGPATSVSLWQVGPSSVQLRDARGDVVAWRALPSESEEATICPGGRTVLAHRWEPNGDRTLPLVVSDTATSTSTELARLGEARPAELLCATPDGSLAVGTYQSVEADGWSIAVLRTDTGDEVHRVDVGGPAEVAVTAGGQVVVASGGALSRLDLDTGALEPVATLETGTMVRALVPHPDGGLSALVSGDNQLSPVRELLTIDADLSSTASWPVEPAGEVTRVAIAADGTRVLEMREGARRVHDPSGVHTRTVAGAPDPERSSSYGATWIGLAGDGTPTWDVDAPEVVEQVLLAPAWRPTLVARLDAPLEVTETMAAVHERDELRSLADGQPPADDAPAPTDTDSNGSVDAGDGDLGDEEAIGASAPADGSGSRWPAVALASAVATSLIAVVVVLRTGRRR